MCFTLSRLQNQPSRGWSLDDIGKTMNTDFPCDLEGNGGAPALGAERAEFLAAEAAGNTPPGMEGKGNPEAEAAAVLAAGCLALD